MKDRIPFATAVRTLVLAALAVTTFAAQADWAAGLAARSPEDQVRDAGRKPAEVLDWLGIGPGMTVMDLVASGGWYTEVLSVAVGPKGLVYAQNPPMIYNFRDGFYDKAMSARLADGRLANVVRLDRDINETGLQPGTLDAAITALNFHDIVNNPGGAEAGAGFLATVKALLKPGGVLGLIDHVGDSDKNNTELHRLDVGAALPIIEAAGFEMASSDLLRNPDDDRTAMVFNPAIRGQTDRVLYKLTKPADGG
ncbi:MAG: class I SAM-dependent methyltransferase [Gammaproteobacteria bacterium]|nr:class I SAM-dependent methyltransferase [Gammaproteobacteria bacterium]MYK27202.1 class I SAM-dependent methyltransferase [Gammaproteobacteria bacterium]MYK82512.1 class I SAM-dependent methyltransferase [Gammaproteobacteria bacterium]